MINKAYTEYKDRYNIKWPAYTSLKHHQLEQYDELMLKLSQQFSTWQAWNTTQAVQQPAFNSMVIGL